MNQQRPGSAPADTPEADLLADAGDYPELHTLLAELRDLGQGPAPEPSPELAAFFTPKVVPLRRKRRGAIIGVVVAASMSLGVGAVAANEEVRENLYAAVDTAVDLVQPDEQDQPTNQANDAGASEDALPALPPAVARPGGADIPAAGAGQRVERSGGPVKAAAGAKEPGNTGGNGAGSQVRASGQPPAVPAAPDSAAKASAGMGQPAGGQANEKAKAKANDQAHGKAHDKPKANKPHKPAGEAIRNAAPNAGKAQQPVKRLVRRAVEGAPLINRGQDKPAPGQAEDKGRGAGEKKSGPVEKIVEKGVDPAVERLGRTLDNVADRD